MTNNDNQIRSLLATYEQALITSDTGLAPAAPNAHGSIDQRPHISRAS